MKKIFLIITSIITFAQSYCLTFSDDDSVYDIGETIESPTNSYTILEQLGSGFFGKVYKVEDSNGQKFALKTCYQENNDGSFFSFFNSLGDFEREFSIGQTLNHPHIIKSFEVFSSVSKSNQPTDNIILQLVNGETINTTPRGSFSKEEGVHAALQAQQALKYAFTQRYIHLDLHSANVMLSSETGLMVIDLASFFSFDEVVNFIKSFSLSTFFYNSTLETLTKRGGLALNLNAITKNKKSETGLGKLREAKLKQFLLNNPKLFNQINQIEITEKNNSLIPLFMNLSTRLPSDVYATIISSFSLYFFADIQGLCSEILLKTNAPREEKVDIVAESYKLVIHYSEDIEEHMLPSFEQYIDRFSQQLTPLLIDAK